MRQFFVFSCPDSQKTTILEQGLVGWGGGAKEL